MACYYFSRFMALMSGQFSAPREEGRAGEPVGCCREDGGAAPRGGSRGVTLLGRAERIPEGGFCAIRMCTDQEPAVSPNPLLSRFQFLFFILIYYFLSSPFPMKTAPGLRFWLRGFHCFYFPSAGNGPLQATAQLLEGQGPVPFAPPRLEAFPSLPPAESPAGVELGQPGLPKAPEGDTLRVRTKDECPEDSYPCPSRTPPTKKGTS
ncbi:trimeric intracellular cation channel type B-B-like [Platysternon megacephalum]|uniref:Trimeric intracellular cation channel type B-B-like n=1 Tax=Platysternon megacephalum TaxID=55544 RepID=A0A4D9E746_9SAUR|nr:trimeric intracellular cation channel type B-B-like [Platysternon megacephalum]